ncbi:acyltransferase family protein [Luteimonas notoginsengisoli]|uniref:Acyltransferase family protein n=1 Tax=Luteimonas notoginsengisoli TaxID=1578200 RepID=A0ABV7UW66_9GAMM
MVEKTLLDGDSTSRQRFVELDALRGLAAMAVVLYHYSTQYGDEIGHASRLPFGFPEGNYGVYLFFMISGFVILMSLERSHSAMDFVVSRVSRLFPAYWSAVALTAAVVWACGMPWQLLPAHDLLLNFTMVQQILGGRHLDGSYWTLQVELFFYVQMLLWFMAGQLARIHWVIAAWLLLAVSYSLAVRYHMHFSYTAREVLLLRHIAFFGLGILFHRMHGHPGEKVRNVCMIGLCLGTIAFVGPPVLLLVAVFGCIVFWLALAGDLQWLRARPLVLLGGLSYSLYLLHQAVGFALIRLLEQHGLPAGVAVTVVVSAMLVLAFALHRGVEQPAMRILRAAWKHHRELHVAAPGRATAL